MPACKALLIPLPAEPFPAVAGRARPALPAHRPGDLAVGARRRAGVALWRARPEQARLARPGSAAAERPQRNPARNASRPGPESDERRRQRRTRPGHHPLPQTGASAETIVLEAMRKRQVQLEAEQARLMTQLQAATRPAPSARPSTLARRRRPWPRRRGAGQRDPEFPGSRPGRPRAAVQRGTAQAVRGALGRSITLRRLPGRLAHRVEPWAPSTTRTRRADASTARCA